MKQAIKSVLKFVGLFPVVKRLLAPDINLSESPEKIFTEIYKKNYWKSKESYSGPGSTLTATTKVRNDILYVINKYQITTIVDIPCGDFNWMKEVNLLEKNIIYLGCDIVPGLIKKNTENYSTTNIRFEEKNIITDKIEKFDLIICRDCLVHFSNEDIFKSIKNIRESNSKYLLVTSFLDVQNNYNIKTGNWRAIDLRKTPFCLDKPLEIFEEQYTEKNWRKILLLYKIDDLETNLLIY